MSKKIVITGASGFLGRHLLERIKDDKQYMTYALSSRSDELREIIGGERVEYIHKDNVSMPEMMNGAIVINCAYPRNSTGTSIADGLKYIQKIFEKSVEYGAAAIINISSQSVYSQQRTEAATEETQICLETPYAVGKYAVELMLESICKGSSTVYTNLRMASLIGPGFDQRIVNRFVKQALETGKLTVKKNQQKFGFCDIKDAVRSITAMLNTNENMWKPVYNLGRNGAYTLVEIAETVRKVIKDREGEYIAIDIVKGNETGNSELDCSLYIYDFSTKSRCSLEESIADIYQNEVEL